jgi:hypothetical protein
MEIATDDLLYDAPTRTFYGVITSHSATTIVVRNKKSGIIMTFCYAGNMREYWVYDRQSIDYFNRFKLMLYRDKATMVEQWMEVRKQSCK